MTAFESARFDDYRQRLANEETLTPREQRDYNTLYAEAQHEWENAKPGFMYGGDYVDVF